VAQSENLVFRLYECQINKTIAFRYTLLQPDCSSRAAGGVVSGCKEFSFVSFSFVLSKENERNY